MRSYYTTKEQSEHLMNVLYIPASTADFVYVKTSAGGHLMVSPDDMENGDYVEYPIWSLGALLDITFTCIDVNSIVIHRDENNINELIHFIEFCESSHAFDYSKLKLIK